MSRLLLHKLCFCTFRDAEILKALEALGKFDDAEPLARKALEGFRCRAGASKTRTTPNSPEARTSFHSQAAKQGASQPCTPALDPCRSKLGGQHPDTLRSVLHFSAVLRVARSKCVSVVLSRSTELFSLEGSQSGSAKHVNSWTQARGQFREAEGLCREVHSRFKKAQGPEPLCSDFFDNGWAMDIRTLCHTFACQVVTVGVPQHRQPLKDLSPEHPDTITAEEYLALWQLTAIGAV